MLVCVDHLFNVFLGRITEGIVAVAEVVTAKEKSESTSPFQLEIICPCQSVSDGLGVL